MAEILHFEILRKHGQTDRQTDMGITIPRPPPMGGEVIIKRCNVIRKKKLRVISRLCQGLPCTYVDM